MLTTSSEPNYVSVTVVGARNLASKGKNDKSEVFVVIKLSGEKFRTSVKRKTSQLEWKEECEFFIQNKYAALQLVVHQKSLMGFDDFLGQIRIPVDEVIELNTQPRNRWYPLKGKSGRTDEHKYRGELEICLKFSKKKPPENLPSPPRSGSVSNLSLTGGHHGLSLSTLKHSASTAFGSILSGLDNKDKEKEKDPTFPGAMPQPQPHEKFTKLSEIDARQQPSSGQLKVQAAVMTSQERMAQSDRLTRKGMDLGLGLTDISLEPTPPNSARPTHPSTPSLPTPSRGGIDTVDLVPKQPFVRTRSRAWDRKHNDSYLENRKSSNLSIPPSRPLSSTIEFRVGDNARSSIGSSVETESELEQLSKPDLISLLKSERLAARQAEARVRDLELYIDDLVYRVMDQRPEILAKNPGVGSNNRGVKV